MSLQSSIMMRRPMYQMIDDFEHTRQEHLNKDYKQELKGSIAKLKTDYSSKLGTVNMECPRLWELRNSMKQRMRQYSKKSHERNEQALATEKQRERDDTREKFNSLFERITKEQMVEYRKRKRRE